MHRFSTKETKHENRNIKGRMLYLIAPILIVAFYIIVSSVNTSTIERQKESLDRALSRDIIHCYAVEGFYPPSLDYLTQHYGLSYNEDIFSVDYHPIASNMKPTYTILTNSNYR